MNPHAADALHGRRMTRAHDPRVSCHAQKLVEDHQVVYQASGRAR